MNEKLLTSETFKDKKSSYPSSVSVTFKSDRLTDLDYFKKIPKTKLEIYEKKKFLFSQDEKIKVNFF